MCLGVPGEVVGAPSGELRMAPVSFAGVQRQVSLVYVPEANVGDYVVVHAGFAISLLDAEAARQTMSWLGQNDDKFAASPEDA